MHAKTIVACLSLAIASTARGAPQSAPPQVAIDSGQIEGTILTSGVQAYLGIPYAAPPVRDLRWRDPQPAIAWRGIYHADRFGPQCLQPLRNALANQYSGAETESEDCLFLNVWTRPDLRNAPVIVFIHGGGFYIGSSSMALYGGENVSREGAVFVNFNYRLGALGFLALPGLSAESPHKTSGNYAFLDEIAALKWVKRNIASFGGDPNNVTIVGQSAGSMSVQILQASPLSKGLFQRAIGMSGSMIGGPGSMLPLADAEQEGLKLQSLLKTRSLADLRALPADRIVVPRTQGAPKIGPDQDGYVLPEPVEQTFAQSRQHDVPVLLGFTHDESFDGLGPVKNLADYQDKAGALFGTRSKAFLELYPANTDNEARAQGRAADRDATMASGMGLWADALVAGDRSKVYSYEFARPHSYAPGVTFYDLDPAATGSYHTSEVPFWLGTLDSFNRYRVTRAWTPADYAFSRAMTLSLIAFARTGNPNTTTMQWPEYDRDHRTLLLLGSSPIKSAWPDERKFDFFRAVDRSKSAGGALRD